MPVPAVVAGPVDTERTGLVMIVIAVGCAVVVVVVVVVVPVVSGA